MEHKVVINRYKKDLLGLEHVIGIGYGLKEKKGKKTGDKAIIVLVDKKMPKDKLENRDIVPMAIEEYRTDVIEIGELNFMDERTSRLRPAQPGISIGHYKISAGTLGAIVRDKDTGESMILSNNHVLANITNGKDGRAQVGDPILQPGKYDNGSKPEDIIGFLERYVPIKISNGEETCPVAKTVERIGNFLVHLFKPDYHMKFYKDSPNNIVDCALAKPKSKDIIKKDILGIGQINGLKEPQVGVKVQKSGRTTGVTKSEIKAVDVTVQIQMSQTEVAIFQDQFITGPMSKPGDSGSLVLDLNNNAVGLLFAGSDKATVCNRISNVFKSLKVEL